jgi:hypothetical protein
MKVTFVGVLAALLLAMPLSCDKEKGLDPAPVPASAGSVAAATAAAAPSAAVAPTPAPAEVENIPVAADFEEEAEKTITKANYKTELDTLEAELKR